MASLRRALGVLGEDFNDYVQIRARSDTATIHSAYQRRLHEHQPREYPQRARYPWQERAGYETAMDVAWNFSYEINSEKLRNLYSKAKQNQWDAEKQA